MREQEIYRSSVADSATLPMAPSSGINLLVIFETLKASRKTIAAVALVSLLLSVATALLLPVRYASVASFIPPTSSSNSSAAALAGQLSALGPTSLLGAVKTSGDLYAGILKSRSIAEKLIEQYQLEKVYGVKRRSDAVKRLATRTDVEIGVKDSIITLTVSDKDPKRAHDLAQAYLDALHDTNGRLALAESSQRRMFYDQQLAKEKDVLEDAEVDLKKSKEQNGLIAPTGQAAVQIETIARTRAQIAARQIELADLRQSSTQQNPMVIRLNSVIADLQSQLAHLENGGSSKDIGNIPVSKVPEVQLDYVRREREVKYHEALFEMIAKQDEVARMDEAHDAPLLQVLDFPSYPDMKSWPPRAIITAGGFVFGIMIGCLWVILHKHFSSAL